MTHEEIAAAVADVIQEHVALSLAPVLSRLAVAEAQVAQFALHTHAVGELRERVVVVETKAAMPAAVVQQAEPREPVDLSPALERIAAAEARLETLGDLRDRMVTVETKVAAPAPVVDLTAVLERIAAVELRLEMKCAETAPILGAIADHGKDISALRERVAVAEVRQLVPGPAGRDGADGQNGLQGKDGADGLGWDDLAVTQIDERSFAVKCTRGLQVKDLGTLTFPVEIYRGVYLDGKAYERGDGVTWGGSEWHCNEATTTKPGDGSKAWTLKVKRGRDGKDGRDADVMPVVSVGKR